MVCMAKEFTDTILKLSSINLAAVAVCIETNKNISDKSSYFCHCKEAILRIMFQDGSLASLHVHRNTNQLDVLYFEKLSQFDERFHQH